MKYRLFVWCSLFGDFISTHATAVSDHLKFRYFFLHFVACLHTGAGSAYSCIVFFLLSTGTLSRRVRASGWARSCHQMRNGLTRSRYRQPLFRGNCKRCSSMHTSIHTFIKKAFSAYSRHNFRKSLSVTLYPKHFISIAASKQRLLRYPTVTFLRRPSISLFLATWERARMYHLREWHGLVFFFWVLLLFSLL